MLSKSKQTTGSVIIKDIFERLKEGEATRLNDPGYDKIQEVVNCTIKLSTDLNDSTDINKIRQRLSEIIGTSGGIPAKFIKTIS